MSTIIPLSSLPTNVRNQLELWRLDKGQRFASLYQTPWGASLETKAGWDRGPAHTVSVHASANDCKALEARYPDLAKFIKGS
jgi:hypothetical protein